MADSDLKPDEQQALGNVSGDADTGEVATDLADQPAPHKKKSLLNNPKALAAIGLGIAILIVIALILAFLSIFKLNHIEKLFVSYEFGQFERAVGSRTTEALKEAEGKASGTGNETVPADAPLEEQLSKLNARQVLDGTDTPNASPKFDNGTYEGFAAADGKPVSIDDPAISGKISEDVLPKTDLISVESTGGAVANLYNLAGDPPAVDENTPDGKQKSPDQVDQETTKAAEDEARGASEPVPTEVLSNETKQADQEIAQGADPEVAIDEAAGRAASKIRSFSPSDLVNIVGNVTVFCVFYDIVHSSVGKATDKIIHGYMNTASMFYAAADKQKEGKLPIDQVGAYNKFFDNSDPKNPQHSFTDSCEYHQANSHPERCTDQNTLPKADRPFQADVPAVIKTLNAVSNVPGLDKLCGVMLDPRVVALGFGASVLVLINDLTAAAGNPEAYASIVATLQSTVIKAALFVGGAEGAKYLISVAMHHYLGTATAISPKTPLQNANKVGAGTKLLAGATAIKSGGRKLTAAESDKLQASVVQDRIAYEKRRGFVYRTFNIDNPRSIAASFLIQLPSTPQSLTASLAGTFAKLTSPVRVASTSATNWLQNTPTAWAASSGDSFGIPHYMLTDNELTKYQILANAKVVEADMKANPSLYQKFDKCFDSTISDLETSKDSDIQHCSVAPGADPKLDRYRVYRFDRNVVHNLVLMGNGQPASQ